MINCPRPGCPGEVVNGNCRECGIAVPTSAGEEAARLRRMAEEQASRLRESAGGGSGWFRAVDEASVRAGGAHRRPEAPSPAAPEPAGQTISGRPSQALPWADAREQAQAPAPDPAPEPPPHDAAGHLGEPPSDGPAPDPESSEQEPRAAGEPSGPPPYEEHGPAEVEPQTRAVQGQPPGRHHSGHEPAAGSESESTGGRHQADQEGRRWTSQVTQLRSPQAQPGPVWQPSSGEPQQFPAQPGPHSRPPGQVPPGQPGQQFASEQPTSSVRPAPPPNVPSGQSTAADPGAPPLWGQNIPMPNVLPREPGTRMEPALGEDDPLPTSVLGETPPTLTIEPPPAAPAAAPDDAAPAAALAEPEKESPHGTGSSSFPTGRRTSSRAASRGRLGAGLVEVPVVPVKDPASAVLKDPVVSENKRFCSNCGAEVGRGVDGRPGPPEGECPDCGTPFNFRPRLFSGDLVSGQYEVLGCLAYGGLGWIYLAKDHNVSDRWVVLKGMIDTGDATSMASAVAERRFLAEVEHPNVVRIYNFVQHPDPKTGTLAGYIVMEYVGGQSLRQLALSHHRQTGRAEPLPIGQVIAYGLEILPAIGYLHSVDMLYCDLKPDNVIQSGEQLKLIDLGAVRQADDYESPLFFTLGYAAPELATEGASVASDLYTVGRTLAVLSIEFSGYTTRHKYTLPGPEEEPLFALFGSYYRVLKRATHKDPVQRFASAEEMADQLTGVLREVMALGTGRPRPGLSTVFAIETRTFGSGMVVGEHGSLPSPDPQEVASILPLPMVDTDDHAASTLASITATEPAEMVAALASAPQDSIEVRLRMVRARLELGDMRAAGAELEAARKLVTDPADWRPDWYEGLIALATRRPLDAAAAFDKVYDAVPGELPPKLALAASAEYAGNFFWAARYYELVWRTDHSWVSAAFGLARMYLAQGARVSAIEVLEQVPETSSHHVNAQVAAIKIKTGANLQVGEHDLHDAARRLERLALDAERRTTLSAEVLEAAYGWVRAGRPGAVGVGSDSRAVLGCRLSERELRFGLERCYRALARLASTPEQRHELVDKANAIRPRTVT
jgi:serine/threonine-protein kinase PknG